MNHPIIRKAAVLAALLILLLPARSGAQETGLDIRAGRSFTLVGRDALPDGHATASLTYHRGLGALAVATDIPTGTQGSLGLNARAGIHAGGKLVAFNPFVVLRCSWQNGFGDLSAGYGAALSFRLLGPLAAYAEITGRHRLNILENRLEISTNSHLSLSVGIQLSI